MNWILIANTTATDSMNLIWSLRVLAILIIIFILGVHLLGSGFFTGNQYRKIDGLLYVKHPGGDWVLLAEHEREQKKLKENK